MVLLILKIVDGTAERRVIPGGGPDQFEFGAFMSVTLSCDHRVIDGMCQLLIHIV